MFKSVFFGVSILLFSLIADAQVTQNYASSVLVCRGRQCAAAEQSMTAAFLFNKLVSLFETNLGHDILICEADPISHVCTENRLAFPATIGVASTSLSIPAMRLLDAKLIKGSLGLNLLFSYYVFADGQTVPCQNALSKIVINSTSKVQMSSAPFECGFSQTGSSSFNTWFLIDYLDFDYGTIGGYYTIGSNKGVKAEKTGYTLLRFTRPQASTVNEINLTPPQQRGPVGQPVYPSGFIPTAAPQQPQQPLPVQAPAPTPQGGQPSQSTQGATTSQTLPVVTVTPEGKIVPKEVQDAYQRYKTIKEQEEQSLAEEASKEEIEAETPSATGNSPSQPEETTEEESAWTLPSAPASTL